MNYSLAGINSGWSPDLNWQDVKGAQESSGIMNGKDRSNQSTLLLMRARDFGTPRDCYLRLDSHVLIFNNEEDVSINGMKLERTIPRLVKEAL
jgi:hypothetical protein